MEYLVILYLILVVTYMFFNNVKVKITNSGVDKFTNFGETSSQ